MTFPLFELPTIVWPPSPSPVTFDVLHRASSNWLSGGGWGATQRFATPRQDGSANYAQIAVLPTAREEKIERNPQIQNRNLHRMNAEKWRKKKKNENKKTSRPTRALHHCPFPHCVALSWAKMSEIIKENRERKRARQNKQGAKQQSLESITPSDNRGVQQLCVFFLWVRYRLKEEATNFKTSSLPISSLFPSHLSAEAEAATADCEATKTLTSTGCRSPGEEGVMGTKGGWWGKMALKFTNWSDFELVKEQI